MKSSCTDLGTIWKHSICICFPRSMSRQWGRWIVVLGCCSETLERKNCPNMILTCHEVLVDVDYNLRHPGIFNNMPCPNNLESPYPEASHVPTAGA